MYTCDQCSQYKRNIENWKQSWSKWFVNCMLFLRFLPFFFISIRLNSFFINNNKNCNIRKKNGTKNKCLTNILRKYSSNMYRYWRKDSNLTAFNWKYTKTVYSIPIAHTTHIHLHAKQFFFIWWINFVGFFCFKFRNGIVYVTDSRFCAT